MGLEQSFGGDFVSLQPKAALNDDRQRQHRANEQGPNGPTRRLNDREQWSVFQCEWIKALGSAHGKLGLVDMKTPSQEPLRALERPQRPYYLSNSEGFTLLTEMVDNFVDKSV